MLARLSNVTKAPVVRAALTSCVVMATGDVICQRIQKRQAAHTQHDWARTARFATIGLTLHGPFFLVGFRWLDRAVTGQPGLKTALLKTCLGQTTLFPTYLASFFLYMAGLEGRGLEGGLGRLRESFVPTYLTGSVFWPTVNVANFMWCPPQYRVLYVNVCGLVWNAYLSWVNSDSPAPAVAVPAAVAQAKELEPKKKRG